MPTQLNSKIALQAFFALALMSSAGGAKAQNTTTECYRSGGGVVCNQRAPNRLDGLNQLTSVLQSIAEDRARDREKAAAAARAAAEEARQNELLRIQRQTAETERARIEALTEQQTYARSQQEAEREAEQLLRTQVSTAVLEGRCDDAKTIALLASRIDMAEQAMRLCKPKVVEVAPTPKLSAKAAKGVAVKGKGVSSMPSKAVASNQTKPAAVPNTPDATNKPFPRPKTDYSSPPASVMAATDENSALSGDPDLMKALQGDADAQVRIGYRYKNGQGVPQDYAKALKWYLKSAEQGNRYGQMHLGTLYYFGLGVSKYFNTAFELFRKAADQNNAEAQTNIGVMYARGDGVPQDYTAAVNWFRKAAELGDDNGQLYLGIRYEAGQGVLQDHEVAAFWYKKAAAQGNARAKEKLAKLASMACADGTSEPLSKGPPFCANHGGIVGLKAAEQGRSNAIQQLGEPINSISFCVDGTLSTSSGDWGCSRHGGVKKLKGTKR